jgi:hypothetical protein
MKNFRKWDNRPMEDWGAYMSEEAKSFFRSFKSFLKRNLPDCQLEGFKANHYDTSGFVTFPNGNIIYVSYSLDRFCNGYAYAHFGASDPMNGVLYRTAKSTKDYTGGMNHFTSMYRLVDSLKEMGCQTVALEAVA